MKRPFGHLVGFSWATFSFASVVAYLWKSSRFIIFVYFIQKKPWKYLRKVARPSMSLSVAHQSIFRLFMKGKFDAYVVWHLVKRVQNWIVDPSTARNFTVLKNLSLDIAPIDLFIIIQLKFVLPSQLDVGCNKAWKKNHRTLIAQETLNRKCTSL